MTTEKLEIFKCAICGNVVQVLLNGAGELVCCGEPMKLMEVQHDKNELGEKHAPKIEFFDNKKFVHVKSHPMQPEHFIQFIEVYSKDKSELHLKFFNYNDVPEFDISNFGEDLEAIELCNIHGLWGENKND